MVMRRNLKFYNYTIIYDVKLLIKYKSDVGKMGWKMSSVSITTLSIVLLLPDNLFFN